MPEELWTEVHDCTGGRDQDHPRNRNAKVGSQEIPGVTGKFSLGVQNKAGPR